MVAHTVPVNCTNNFLQSSASSRKVKKEPSEKCKPRLSSCGTLLPAVVQCTVEKSAQRKQDSPERFNCRTPTNCNIANNICRSPLARPCSAQSTVTITTSLSSSSLLTTAATTTCIVTTTTTTSSKLSSCVSPALGGRLSPVIKCEPTTCGSTTTTSTPPPPPSSPRVPPTSRETARPIGGVSGHRSHQKRPTPETTRSSVKDPTSTIAARGKATTSWSVCTSSSSSTSVHPGRPSSSTSSAAAHCVVTSSSHVVPSPRSTPASSVTSLRRPSSVHVAHHAPPPPVLTLPPPPHHHPHMFVPPLGTPHTPPSVATSLSLANRVGVHAGIHPGVHHGPPPPSPFGAEALSLSANVDMLTARQELNARFLHDRGFGAAAPFAPSQAYLRAAELHQHMHQHQHTHQHYNGYPPHPPASLNPALAAAQSNAAAAHLYDKLHKFDARPFFVQNVSGLPGYPPISPLVSGLPNSSSLGSTVGSRVHGAFQPKNSTTSMHHTQLLMSMRDREKATQPTGGKSGKWCSAHVRIAWAIHTQQQAHEHSTTGGGGTSTSSGMGVDRAASDVKPSDPLCHAVLPGGGAGNSGGGATRPSDLHSPLIAHGAHSRSPFTNSTPPTPNAATFLNPAHLGSSAYPRSSHFGPVPPGVNSAVFSSLGLPPSLYAAAASRDIAATLGSEWGRLHRTPPSFPTPPTPPSAVWPKLEREAEREREERGREAEREREQRSRDALARSSPRDHGYYNHHLPQHHHNKEKDLSLRPELLRDREMREKHRENSMLSSSSHSHQDSHAHPHHNHHRSSGHTAHQQNSSPVTTHHMKPEPRSRSRSPLRTSVNRLKDEPPLYSTDPQQQQPPLWSPYTNGGSHLHHQQQTDALRRLSLGNELLLRARMGHTDLFSPSHKLLPPMMPPTAGAMYGPRSLGGGKMPCVIPPPPLIPSCTAGRPNSSGGKANDGQAARTENGHDPELQTR